MKNNNNDYLSRVIIFFFIVVYSNLLIPETNSATVDGLAYMKQDYVGVTCFLTNNYPLPGEIIEGKLTTTFNVNVNCDILLVPKNTRKGEYKPPVLQGDTLVTEFQAKKEGLQSDKVKIDLSKSHDIYNNNSKESVENKQILKEIAVYAPVKAYIKLSKEPRLKETVTATITVTFLDDISYIFRNKDEMIKSKTHDKFVKMWSKNLRWDKNIPRHMKLVLIPSKGVEILNGNKEIYWDMMKGETKSFQIDLRLNSSPISLSGVIKWFFAKEKKGARLVAPVKGIGFVLLNKKTEQLGTRKELQELLMKLPEYRYDIILGKRENKWEFCPREEVERLRETLPNSALKSLVKIQEQIKEIQMLDSTITDLEILEMLHDITYQMVVRYGIHKKEESLPILLKSRKLMKGQELSKWEIIDEIIEEMNQKRQRMKLIWSTAVFSSLILFLIFLIALVRMKRRKIR